MLRVNTYLIYIDEDYGHPSTMLVYILEDTVGNHPYSSEFISEIISRIHDEPEDVEAYSYLPLKHLVHKWFDETSDMLNEFSPMYRQYNDDDEEEDSSLDFTLQEMKSVLDLMKEDICDHAVVTPKMWQKWIAKLTQCSQYYTHDYPLHIIQRLNSRCQYRARTIYPITEEEDNKLHDILTTTLKHTPQLTCIELHKILRLIDDMFVRNRKPRIILSDMYKPDVCTLSKEAQDYLQNNLVTRVWPEDDIYNFTMEMVRYYQQNTNHPISKTTIASLLISYWGRY